MAPGEPGSSWLYETDQLRGEVSCPGKGQASHAPRGHQQHPGKKQLCTSKHLVRGIQCEKQLRLWERETGRGSPVGGRRVLCRARRGEGQHRPQPHAKAEPPCLGTVNSPAPSKPPRRVPKQQERVLLCCFKLKSLRFVELSAAGGNKTVHRLIIEMRQFTTDASPPVEAARA